MAVLNQIELPDGITYNFKDNSQTYSDHRHYDSDMVPLVHKKYESTSYYGTTNNWENTSWYFMSVKPDEWYKPWRVKLKVHTYCPNYSGYHSYTWSEIYGRETSFIYADWNEKYNSAHSYLTFYPLKKAGFDAGYGHAIGVSIYNADSRTSSAYYRTFEIDYYECENCTVTILDTPVKWSSWTGTGSTNYGNLASLDAITRGLRETGDDNTTTENRIAYFAGKTGNKGIWATSLFMEDANGTYQNICTASDGTVTSSNRTTATTKIANTNGFKVGSPIWHTNSSYAANTNINGSAVIYSSVSVFDTRYSFNTTLTAGSLTAYKPLYLVGTINSTDNLFYLDSVWWTQTPNNTDKVYVLVGGVYDSTTSYCRATLYEQNKWYRYNGSSLVEIVNEANMVNGHTVESDVPSNADFDNTTYGISVDGANVKLTAGGTGTTAGLSDLINGLGEGTSPAQLNDYLVTQYAGGGTTTKTYHRRAVKNVVNKTVVDNALGKGSDTTKYYRNDGTWVKPPNDNTTYTFAGGTNKFTVTPSGGTAQTVTVTPSIANNVTGSGTSGKVAKFTGANTIGDGYSVDTTVTSGSANLVTSGAVYTAIDALPEPMIFKGSVGTGGTITTLPTATAANEGFTYKVITVMTTPVTAKVGDTVISNGTEWVVIPSGDEPKGTVTSVGIINGGGLTISGSPVTDSGSITVGHSNSVTAQTTQKVYPIKIDAYGHISAYGTSPTTLSGYGITDAKIASGTITLGSNTITPLTASSTLDATKLSGTIPTSCYTDTKNTAGSIDTSSKIFLIGATSQAANPQTYSDNEVYVTSGVLTTKSVQVGGTACTMQYNSTTESLDFVFA